MVPIKCLCNRRPPALSTPAIEPLVRLAADRGLSFLVLISVIVKRPPRQRRVLTRRAADGRHGMPLAQAPAAGRSAAIKPRWFTPAGLSLLDRFAMSASASRSHQEFDRASARHRVEHTDVAVAAFEPQRRSQPSIGARAGFATSRRRAPLSVQQRVDALAQIARLGVGESTERPCRVRVTAAARATAVADPERISP